MGTGCWAGLFVTLAVLGVEPQASAPIRAGAAVVDASPTKFPVKVNGGFLQATANAVRDPIQAKALVFDNGTTVLAIAVVDSCMMPRDLLDRAKQRAHERTGIPTDRMLISATHTHTAPAAMGALGCDADVAYVEMLPERIAEAIAQAFELRVPAKVGWAALDDFEHTHCRRWIRRPDKLVVDPFGQASGRAHMHPGFQNPDALAPSGPVDPALTILAVRTLDDRPLAILANYSMHYFGTSPVSADYYGRFARTLAAEVARDARTPPAKAGDPELVVMMSQGTSGDQQWMDYGQPRTDLTLEKYADDVAAVALRAYRGIDGYVDRVPLAMAETILTLKRRTPDAERLRWAEAILAKMPADTPPRNLPEVYAREAVLLHRDPVRELRLQALRVGGLAILAIPNEVYALTGLKLKAQSPLPLTMNIELANGSEGYIPPPAQHRLGGYTTWPARTAGLEVEAEPRIVETILGLLETIGGQQRTKPQPPTGPYVAAVLRSSPWAYWRLEEWEGERANDATCMDRPARYEGGVAYWLDGPESVRVTGTKDRLNRAPHLAGGRIVTPDLPESDAMTIEFWFWNALPDDARAVTGEVLRLGDGPNAPRLRIGGTEGGAPGHLRFEVGDQAPSVGRTRVGLKTWHHLGLVFRGGEFAVYLNGRKEPELVAKVPGKLTGRAYFGGRDDGPTSFEGKVDEIAVYDEALAPADFYRHLQSVVGSLPR